MSVPAAMRFLRAAREDPDLRARVQALVPRDDLGAVAALAREAGYDVTLEDLRQAHRHDWALRLAAYRA